MGSCEDLVKSVHLFHQMKTLLDYTELFLKD
jgi:hypothetical protein